jgi:hypothetical protein
VTVAILFFSYFLLLITFFFLQAHISPHNYGFLVHSTFVYIFLYVAQTARLFCRINIVATTLGTYIASNNSAYTILYHH